MWNLFVRLRSRCIEMGHERSLSCCFVAKNLQIIEQDPGKELKLHEKMYEMGILGMVLARTAKRSPGSGWVQRKGEKGLATERGTHVPLIVNAPSIIPEKIVSDCFERSPRITQESPK